MAYNETDIRVPIMYLPVVEILYMRVKDEKEALNYVFSLDFFSNLCPKSFHSLCRRYSVSF